MHANGAELAISYQGDVMLKRVKPLADDGQSRLYRLQFRSRSGAMPEGTYALDCGWCTEQLFLQPGIEGPVACINRLLPFKN